MLEAFEDGQPARDRMSLVGIGSSVDSRDVAVGQRDLRSRRELGEGATAGTVDVVAGEIRRRGRGAPRKVDPAGGLLRTDEGARSLGSLVDVERVVAVEPAHP